MGPNKVELLKLTLLGFTSIETYLGATLYGNDRCTVYLYPSSDTFTLIMKHGIGRSTIIAREPWVENESMLRIIEELGKYGAEQGG